MVIDKTIYVIVWTVIYPVGYYSIMLPILCQALHTTEWAGQGQLSQGLPSTFHSVTLVFRHIRHSFLSSRLCWAIFLPINKRLFSPCAPPTRLPLILKSPVPLHVKRPWTDHGEMYYKRNRSCACLKNTTRRDNVNNSMAIEITYQLQICRRPMGPWDPHVEPTPVRPVRLCHTWVAWPPLHPNLFFPLKSIRQK